MSENNELEKEPRPEDLELLRGLTAGVDESRNRVFSQLLKSIVVRGEAE